MLQRDEGFFLYKYLEQYKFYKAFLQNAMKNQK